MDCSPSGAKAGAQHGDLLDVLLQARDEETGEGLSDQELRGRSLDDLCGWTRDHRQCARLDLVSPRDPS